MPSMEASNANTEPPQLRAYRFMVQQLIDMGSPTIIQNSSPSHARIILEQMFATAKKSALVFCGCLSSDVWGSKTMLTNVQKAIDDNVEVRFVIQRSDPDKRAAELFQKLEEKQVVYTDASLANLDALHFAVFDGKMYRIEKNDAEKSATACAYDVETSRILEDYVRRMVVYVERRRNASQL